MLGATQGAVGPADVTAIAISLVSLGVSALALHQSKRQADAADGILGIEQVRDEAAQKDRADFKAADLRISAEASRIPGVGSLIVFNSGPGKAHEVALSIIRVKDGLSSSPRLKEDFAKITSLSDGERQSIKFALTPETSRSFVVQLLWTDTHRHISEQHVKV